MADLPSQNGIPAGPRAAAQGLTVPRALLRLMRPRQWTKNLLVFAALVFAKDLFVAEPFGLTVLAFAAFCMASSSVYIVNDVLDVERDRLHPSKRLRPIAAGEVSTGTAGIVAAVLTAGALLAAFWLRPAFAVVIALYIGLSHAYSLGGKNVVILDVMFIATGFVLRAVGGAVAIAVPSSDWFVLCTFFVALFLALSKRRAELVALERGAGSHRPVLDQYSRETLQALSAASMATVLITYALYVMDFHEPSGGRVPMLALTVPFVLFCVFRYHHLVDTTNLGDKPEEVLLRDRPTQLGVLGFVLAAIGALYVAGPG